MTAMRVVEVLLLPLPLPFTRPGVVVLKAVGRSVLEAGVVIGIDMDTVTVVGVGTDVVVEMDIVVELDRVVGSDVDDGLEVVLAVTVSNVEGTVVVESVGSAIGMRKLVLVEEVLALAEEGMAVVERGGCVLGAIKLSILIKPVGIINSRCS